MHDNLIKKFLVSTVYRDNSVRKIIFGSSRGLKYKINRISGRQAIYGGNERYTQKALVGLVKKNMIVYDIGANCGLFTILLSKLVGEGGQVYSFEPVPYMAEQIGINVRLNNINNVTIVMKAVSDSVSLKSFDLGEGPSLGHIVDIPESNSMHYIKVSCITLDHFVFSENNSFPQVIKIDVEGSESKVLDGARQVIERYRPFIVCELHNPIQDELVGKILIKHHYGAYRLENGEYVKELSKGWPLPTGLWGHFVGYPLEKNYTIRNLFRKG